MSPPIVLFDIDGTLVHAGGAGRRAFGRALEIHFGPAPSTNADHLTGIQLDGMTDRLIVREVMAKQGREFGEAICERVFGTYVEILVKEIRGPDYRVLPGVTEVILALQARGALLGLCTGNVREGARIKLARGRIDGHFTFGDGSVSGFAEDGEARERIVRAALGRVAVALGRKVEPREVLIVGDTPRDVEAAHAVGCSVLAVATGRFGVEDLRRSGADRVVSSLQEPQLMDMLLSQSNR